LEFLLNQEAGSTWIAHHADGVNFDTVLFGRRRQAVDEYPIQKGVGTEEKASPEAPAGYQIRAVREHAPRKRHVLLFDRLPR
jgi:hypothetical protein